MELPIITLREVHFREKKKGGGKKKVLGRIDVVAGRPQNGKKPSIRVDIDGNNVQKVFLGSICEAKNITVRLSEDSRTAEDEGLKTIYQPITELCAMSEVCTFAEESDEIPLVNIYASRHTYRPFLYFKHYDVLLTTQRPIAYVRTDKTKFDIHGLALLKNLFLFDCYPFKKEALERITQSMWRAAQNGQAIYSDVYLSTEAPGAEVATRDPNIMPFVVSTPRELLKRRLIPT